MSVSATSQRPQRILTGSNDTLHAVARQLGVPDQKYGAFLKEFIRANPRLKGSLDRSDKLPPRTLLNVPGTYDDFVVAAKKKVELNPQARSGNSDVLGSIAGTASLPSIQLPQYDLDGNITGYFILGGRGSAGSGAGTSSGGGGTIPSDAAIDFGGDTGGKRIVDVAKKWLGTHEAGNNGNPFSTAMGRPAEAWCADFVSYAASRAGLGSVNSASAQGIQDQLAAQGRWKGRSSPTVGDAVTFNWNGSGGRADHVGLVEGVVKDSSGQVVGVKVISGNMSDQVQESYYPITSPVIKGFGNIA